MPQVLPLAAVNSLPLDDFLEFFGSLYGSALWVPVMAFEHRPFMSVEDLVQTLGEIAATAHPRAKEELLGLQPDFLKDSPRRPAAERRATAKLTREEIRTLTKLQLAYAKKFGFPLVLALDGRGPEDWEAASARLENTPEQEVTNSLDEMNRLVRLRVTEKVTAA